MIQLGIAIFGLTAVFLTQQSNEKIKKYACILGMISQPFWFISAIQAKQWGILILTIFYTYSWGLGIYNNFIKNKSH